MSLLWSLHSSRVLRAALAILSVCATFLSTGPFVGVPTARAQTDSIDPLALLLTAEDAGADATQVRETQGEDGQSRWARRRWEREEASQEGSSGSKQREKGAAPSSQNIESSYGTSGPLVLENAVYVARDLSTARQVYTNEVGKQPKFPEATNRLTGAFPFPMTPLGDESSALSACNDCMAKDEIYVHRRSVIRKGPVVTVVYTYGNDKVITEDLATWFAGQAVSRIPDDIVTAGGPPLSNQAPSASTDGSQPAPQSQPTQA